MTLAWLPTAVRDEHDPRPFPWAETTDPKGCLHTTETAHKPTYDGWTIEPHGSIVPTPNVGVTVYQHVPLTQGSFSLRHTRPQPTGGDYVFQWELVGTCAKGGPGYYWPEADNAVLLDLWRKLVKPLHNAEAIPFRALRFLPYPYLAGANRLTDAQFDTYSGWLGHQHVPQNDHGDPGAFPWPRMAALAALDAPEDDMTPADIKALAAAVLREPVTSDWDGKPHTLEATIASAQRYAIEGGYNGDRPPGNGLPGTPTVAAQVLDRLESLEAAVAKLTPPPAQ